VLGVEPAELEDGLCQNDRHLRVVGQPPRPEARVDEIGHAPVDVSDRVGAHAFDRRPQGVADGASDQRSLEPVTRGDHQSSFSLPG